MNITIAQAELCADFMLDMDPAELAAPLAVLDEVSAYENAVTLKDERLKNFTLRRLAATIDSWLRIDRAACVGLLGPGIGIDQ